MLEVNLGSQSQKQKVINALSGLQGIETIHVDTEDGRLPVTGDVDPEVVLICVRKIEMADLISVAHAT